MKMMDASQISHDVFLRVLAVSAQASILALLIVALQRLLRDCLSPAWRYALWVLLPARLLLLWSVPSSWSLYTVLQHGWSGMCSVVLAPAAQASVFGESFSPASPAAVPAFTGMEWVVGIWLCGAALTLALAMMQAYRLGRQTKRRTLVTDTGVLSLLDECRQLMRIRRHIPVLCGPDTSTPGLLGYLRPRLLVPLRLLAPEARGHLRCVLLHELAHIRRQDVLTGWLAYLLLSLHWFNPVLWWAKRRCIDDRELACDARVLSVLTPKERRAYGHALLDQFRAASLSFSSPGLVGVLEGNSSIERRIEMIASFGKSTRKGTIPALTVLLLLAMTALTGTEETVLSNPSAQAIATMAVAQEEPILLAQETAPVQGISLPAETAESAALQPEAAPPTEEPAATPVAVTQAKLDTPHAPAATAPAKSDKNRTKAFKSTAEPATALVPGTAASVTYATAIPAAPDATFGPGSAIAAEAEAASSVPPEKPAGKNPPTLHSAVNKVAEDYAKSLEAKSTRPGEDLPFTLTVGGEIRIRGEYRTGMPCQVGASRNGFATSMNTRVGVCADFGQVQCVAEVSRTEGSGRLFGPRDVD
jgi:bla regulator protein BlaR1